jgi:hypothetical protein
MDLPDGSPSHLRADCAGAAKRAAETRCKGKTNMANRIGEIYRCSDPDCGCEVEILRPCGLEDSDPSETRRRSGGSSELSTPPSAVTTPRVGPGLEEGAGERTGSYGSPRFEQEIRGPFRADDGLGGTTTAIETGTPLVAALGSLICFCGNPMSLATVRSRSARAGASI